MSETYISEHQGTWQLCQLLHGDASPLTDACGICTVVHHMQQREEQRHKPEPRTEIDLQHPFIAAQPKYQRHNNTCRKSAVDVAKADTIKVIAAAPNVTYSRLRLRGRRKAVSSNTGGIRMTTHSGR